MAECMPFSGQGDMLQLFQLFRKQVGVMAFCRLYLIFGKRRELFSYQTLADGFVQYGPDVAKMFGYSVCAQLFAFQKLLERQQCFIVQLPERYAG